MSGRPWEPPKAERCIDACYKAHVENGRWVCPMFVNVDRVVTVSERGVPCRRFARRRGDG